MSHDAPAPRPPDEDIFASMARLQAAGAESADAVGWHYIRTLAERARAQPDPVQDLLHHKLRQALQDIETRLVEQTVAAETREAEQAAKTADAMGAQNDTLAAPPVSPLALLLQDMGGSMVTAASAAHSPSALPDSPRVRQLRQQLRRIGVQKQVSRAMASGPLNAGPINSHMLVLRALGLLRDIAPEYLNRFMVHLDTLLCLHDHQAQAAAPDRSARPRKTARS